MIDFHCHILPAIDDGSRDVSESLAMISAEIDQGVDGIVLTPHFYAEKDDRRYLERRSDRYDKLKSAVDESEFAGKVTLLLGSEVCYFPGCSKADIMDKLVMGNSRYILLEMPFMQWTDSMIRDVESLIEDRGFKPVIAHIERYYGFQRDRSYWQDLFDMDVIPQMNAGAFIGKWLKKYKNFRLMKEAGDIVLGSDAHNMVNRCPNLALGFREIEKKLGSQMVEDIQRRSRDLFEKMR